MIIYLLALEERGKRLCIGKVGFTKNLTNYKQVPIQKLNAIVSYKNGFSS